MLSYLWSASVLPYLWSRPGSQPFSKAANVFSQWLCQVMAGGEVVHFVAGGQHHGKIVMMLGASPWGRRLAVHMVKTASDTQGCNFATN